MRASSRDLERATKTARRGIVRALDALSDRGLIATRQGHATKAAAHILRFLEVAQLGGVLKTPPLPVTGAPATPGAVLFEHQGGVEATPPPTENEGLATEPSRLDIEPDRLKKLDRVLQAKPEAYDRGELRRVRGLLSWANEKMHGSDQHPADFTMCAQLHEACDRRHDALEWLTREIHNARQQPGGPGWWVTVALQRIHGIDAKVTAARRAELKAAKRPTLLKQIEAVAAAKRF